MNGEDNEFAVDFGNGSLGDIQAPSDNVPNDNENSDSTDFMNVFTATSTAAAIEYGAKGGVPKNDSTDADPFASMDGSVGNDNGHLQTSAGALEGMVPFAAFEAENDVFGGNDFMFNGGNEAHDLRPFGGNELEQFEPSKDEIRGSFVTKFEYDNDLVQGKAIGIDSTTDQNNNVSVSSAFQESLLKLEERYYIEASGSRITKLGLHGSMYDITGSRKLVTEIKTDNRLLIKAKRTCYSNGSIVLPQTSSQAKGASNKECMIFQNHDKPAPPSLHCSLRRTIDGLTYGVRLRNVNKEEMKLEEVSVILKLAPQQPQSVSTNDISVEPCMSSPHGSYDKSANSMEWQMKELKLQHHEDPKLFLMKIRPTAIAIDVPAVVIVKAIVSRDKTMSGIERGLVVRENGKVLYQYGQSKSCFNIKSSIEIRQTERIEN